MLIGNDFLKNYLASQQWREPPAWFDLQTLQTRTRLAQSAALTLRHRRVVLYAGLDALHFSVPKQRRIVTIRTVFLRQMWILRRRLFPVLGHAMLPATPRRVPNRCQ
jgi:hypothetical protein